MARGFESLRRRSAFTRLYRRGRRFSLPDFALYALPGRAPGDRPRIGISIAKDVGRAVVRNRVRRRLQCSFDELGVARLGSVQLLVIARPGAAGLPFRQVREQVARALTLAEAAV